MSSNTDKEMKKKLNELKGSKMPEPIRSDGAGARDLGPRDIMRDGENPDMLVPPATDYGLLPNLKFSFSDTHMNIRQGGWAREITQRELPVSSTLALVDMCLSPGVREMHSHLQAEWAYMLKGSARVTAVDERGRNFIEDIHPGEGWLFPANIPHSIQGLADGCEFLLLFDKGDFSETSTFSISELFSHLPMDVLSANFGAPESVFSSIPKEEVYITYGGEPGSLKSQEVKSPYGKVPLSFKHELINVKPIKCPGGTVRILDSENFPISKTIAAALVEVKPGAMREIHWHPNNDEFQYYISGEARMTVFMPGPKARTFNYRAGDVGYVPVGGFHYVQNISNEPLIFLEMFKSSHWADISLAQWIAMTPNEVVQSCLNLSPEFLNSINKESCPIVKYPGYEFPVAQSTPQNISRFKH